MSLQEFLHMETSNIEALNENQNKNNANNGNINIRPSVVWIRARENDLEETYFSHEMEQDDGRDFDDESLQKDLKTLSFNISTSSLTNFL